MQVAKDRAVEGLVLVGARFVVNVLGQNKSNAVAKQLLKPFLPGENRMEGLETTVASNGGLILKDAVRKLPCMFLTVDFSPGSFLGILDAVFFLPDIGHDTLGLLTLHYVRAKQTIGYSGFGCQRSKNDVSEDKRFIFRMTRVSWTRLRNLNL